MGGGASITFEITHPFHPHRGHRFHLATRKQNWGEDRVMYYDARGRLRSMLTSWTSVEAGDAFHVAAAGRSLFRTDDLLRLSVLIDELRGAAPNVK